MDIHSREDQIFIQYHQEHFYNTLYSVRVGGSTKQIHSSVSRVNLDFSSWQIHNWITKKVDREIRPSKRVSRSNRSHQLVDLDRTHHRPAPPSDRHPSSSPIADLSYFASPRAPLGPLQYPIIIRSSRQGSKTAASAHRWSSYIVSPTKAALTPPQSGWIELIMLRNGSTDMVSYYP
jgi:hypothetical protein